MKAILDEVEIVSDTERPIKLSEPMYLNKATKTETSSYERVQRALKKLDTAYNKTMMKGHEPIIEGK